MSLVFRVVLYCLHSLAFGFVEALMSSQLSEKVWRPHEVISIESLTLESLTLKYRRSADHKANIQSVNHMAVTQVDMSMHIGARQSISETADIVGFSHITIFMDNTELQKVKSSHQVDKVLITDLSISIAISKGQQDF